MASAVLTTVVTDRLRQDINAYDARKTSQWAVRRPLLGTFLGQETFASLSLENFSPTNVQEGLANSSAHPDDPATSTANFVLQSVQEQRIEKSQILTTFGTSYAYFFGEQPRQLEVTALLLNTPNFRWDLEWFYNYENFLRGSKLAASNTVAVLTYDNCIVRGYLTACTLGKTADNPRSVPLNFSMFVLDVFFDETSARSRHELLNEQKTFPDYGTPILGRYSELIGLGTKTVVPADQGYDAATTSIYAWNNPLEYVAGYERRPYVPRTVLPPETTTPAENTQVPDDITLVTAEPTPTLPEQGMTQVDMAADLEDQQAMIAEGRAAARALDEVINSRASDMSRRGASPLRPQNGT